MRLTLPPEETARLVIALSKAKSNEIGGQLYGELIAASEFKVTELTIQARSGSFSRFIVDLLQAAQDAIRFFNKTDHNYMRFNYIGEWHSHPSFEVVPSTTDVNTMRELVDDPEFAGTFAVLMIVRLDGQDLSAGAWLFDPEGPIVSVDLEVQT